jgi:retron-type reverse transcriptase
MINRLEYGVQIRGIHANFSFTQKNIALKKQVENNIFFLNEAIVDKPFLVKKYVVSCGSALLELRRRCNGIFPACFLVDSFVKTKILSREFSSTVEIESERFKRSILEDLKGDKWPTDCIKKRKVINDYVQSVQNQILFCKGEQQLEFIASHVFDIRNRIFSINKVFNESKSSSYGQVGYSDLTLKSHKFILLKQTKLINLSKLPPCKIVMVEIPKANGGKRSLGINMPVDKVLQRMFLNFLDVLIEEDLKPEVFAYRKGRDARMAVASVYAKLNRAKYIKQMCLCSVDIEKCFDNFFHHQIVEQYPFPKSYGFLLSRWLTPNLIDKNRDFKNLGRVNRGVPQGSILGPSIANLLLSNAFPENILKERGRNRQKVWADIFSYADDIILIANNQAIFFRHLTQLRKNLKKLVCR